MSETRAPMVVTQDGEVPFTKPVAGVAPTAAAHLATKAYVDAGGSGGVSDHGALTGLADDDHTQYIPVNASRQPSAPLGSVAAPTIPEHYVRGTELTASQSAQDAATLAFLSAFYMPLGGSVTALAMNTARFLARTTAGTGAVEQLTDAQMRTALGLGAIALLASVSLTANVTGTLPIANGGTGATSASAARTALDVARSVHGHAAVDVTIDDSEFTGALARQGITDVQTLAAWLDANLGA